MANKARSSGGGSIRTPSKPSPTPTKAQPTILSKPASAAKSQPNDTAIPTTTTSKHSAPKHAVRAKPAEETKRRQKEEEDEDDEGRDADEVDGEEAHSEQKEEQEGDEIVGTADDDEIIEQDEDEEEEEAKSAPAPHKQRTQTAAAVNGQRKAAVGTMHKEKPADSKSRKRKHDDTQSTSASSSSSLPAATSASSTVDASVTTASTDLSSLDPSLQPPPIQYDFTALPLHANTQRAITAMGFTRMTEIQARTIPPLLAGQDIIAQAKTGSGKVSLQALPLRSPLLSLHT